MGWLLALGVLTCARFRGVRGGQVKYWQNCAARGPCRKVYGQGRDPEINEAAPGSPKGHMKPLGHRDFEDSWDGEIDILPELEPEVFWTKYHAHSKPFLLKGASSASPAMHWTDEYIMEKFGDVVGKTEWQNEDRLTDYCGQRIFGETVKCPRDTIPYVETRMNIRTFINRSQADPDNFQKYIISQMPDNMGSEFHVPGFHLCGKRDQAEAPEGMPWLTQMYENNFWYVRTKPGEMATSTIHYDQNHQIMCLFSGKKEWIMWDLNVDRKNIPMWNRYFRPGGMSQGSDDSPIDGERVDLERWPDFAKARWSNVTMEPGDCLYTPANLLHYVRSFSDSVDKPTIALMTMFQREEKFSKLHCQDTPKTVSLANFDTLWDFPGSDAAPFCKNHVKMGYSNWKTHLLKPLRRKAKGKPLTREVFMDHFRRVAPRPYPKKRISSAWSEIAGKDSQEAPESWPRSLALFNLARDISCMQWGHRGPGKALANGVEWTARDEMSLSRDDDGIVDEVHAEL